MNLLNHRRAKALCGLVLGLSMVNIAQAQLTVDVSGNVFDWSIGGSGEDGYADRLIREPGPAWALGLHCTHRPDSEWVGLAFGLRYERREFDVAFRSGGLGGGVNGEEYVRLGSLYISTAVNIKLHPNGRWWAQPGIAVLCFNEGLASGWKQSWGYMASSSTTEYRGKYTREHGAPFFTSFRFEHLQPLGGNWFVTYQAFAGQSFSLRRSTAPFGAWQYQLGVGVGFSFRFGDAWLDRVGEAVRQDREARKDH